jgi:hypothetical protein
MRQGEGFKGCFESSHASRALTRTLLGVREAEGCSSLLVLLTSF